TSIADGPNGAFIFAPNTTYTGSLTITRSTATDMVVTGALGAANFSVLDTFDSADIGMIAFWANSNIFGSSSTAHTPHNRIDSSNIKIEFNPVAEPARVGLFVVMSLMLALSSGHRKRR